MSRFANTLIRWQRACGRNDLPWQRSRDPYLVWLSEVMLQQTQVQSVIPYFERFVRRFPDLRSLAGASQDDVLRLWSGLGYYARARNLLAAACRVEAEHGGRFPRDAAALARLPGIGRSTAAAIAAFAFGRHEAILDGNVKRVLARSFGVEGYPGEAAVERRLWALAQDLLPGRCIETYTQALMDLGATVCTRSRPRCAACPVAEQCVARRAGRVAELPTPRPRRAQPQRRTKWLVLRHEGRVLLERRPPAGVWGGLWTFPELAGAQVRAHCRRTLGCEVGFIRRLDAIEHSFTHFRLRAQPVLCELERLSARAESPGRRWVLPGRTSPVPVPVPVRRLLHSLGATAERALRRGTRRLTAP